MRAKVTTYMHGRIRPEIRGVPENCRYFAIRHGVLIRVFSYTQVELASEKGKSRSAYVCLFLNGEVDRPDSSLCEI